MKYPQVPALSFDFLPTCAYIGTRVPAGPFIYTHTRACARPRCARTWGYPRTSNQDGQA